MSLLPKRVLYAGLVWALIVAPGISRADDAEGQKLFEQRCAACHQLPDPAAPPPVGWQKQLEKMGLFARLNDAQKQEVLSYLMTHSTQQSKQASLQEDRAFFEEKCGHCHTVDRILLEQPKGDTLAHVINRMQNRSGSDWISDDDAERLLTYLSSENALPEPDNAIDDSATPQKLFETRCSACHTLERVFQHLQESDNPGEYWSHTVNRMRGKAPRWISDTEASKINDFLQSQLPAQSQELAE